MITYIATLIVPYMEKVIPHFLLAVSLRLCVFTLVHLHHEYGEFCIILGERFERGIQDAVILESDEALVVVAQEEFDDVTQDGKRH